MNSEQSILLQGQADYQTSAVKSLEERAKKRIEAILIKCAGCKQLLYSRSCAENRKVCPLCNYHLRMSTSERLQMLFPEGGFYELNSTLKTADPLHFIDRGESYRSKVDAVRATTGLNEALTTGIGPLNGQMLAVAVTDFAFLGASMGSVFGEKLVRLIEQAIEQRLPLLTISCSGGARMHEGIFSLLQMAKITSALSLLSHARLPHISLLTHPCYGGVTASYATIADIILAEPGAMIGFAGPRVIEQVTRQKLPKQFQSAEFWLEHGMIDRIVSRYELIPLLSDLLSVYQYRRPAPIQPEGLLDIIL
jgi:acetyl-CoA carboxylase carboxyl transferase subunit beta